MTDAVSQAELVEQTPGQHMSGGGFAGAEKLDRQIGLWYPPHQSADSVLLPVKEDLDYRAIDLSSNDGYVQAVADKYRDSIVGSQYRLNSKPNWKYLGLNHEWAREFQDEVETKFTLYAENRDCWIDASGVNTFTGLVRLAVGGQYSQHGEILSTAEWIRDNHRPMHTAVQMIDPARLSNPDGRPASRNLRGGVQTNKWGRAQIHWIRDGHPSDIFSDYRLMRWKPVRTYKPWGRKQVIHILEQRRTDQTRGYSALVAALKSIRTRKRLTDVELQNVALNAMYAAALETDLPPDVAAAVLGGDDLNTLGESASYTSLIKQIQAVLGGKNVYLDGAKVPVLPPGTKLRMQRAAAQANSQFSFENSLLRQEARTAGLSYEEYSGDFTKTNMASAARAMAETLKFMQARKAMLADPFATDIFALWLEEAISMGDIESLPAGFDVITFNTGLNKAALTRCTWLGAPQPETNPQQARMSERMALEDNTATLEEICAKKGLDYRDVLMQRKREQDLIEELELPTLSAAEKTVPADRDDEDNDQDDKPDDAEDSDDNDD